MQKFSYKSQNWDQLVNFMDYVKDLEQYDGIVFLQVIYRFLAKQNVPPEFIGEALKWAQADDSRGQLVKTFNRCRHLAKNKPKKNKRKH